MIANLPGADSPSRPHHDCHDDCQECDHDHELPRCHSQPEMPHCHTFDEYEVPRSNSTRRRRALLRPRLGPIDLKIPTSDNARERGFVALRQWSIVIPGKHRILRLMAPIAAGSDTRLSANHEHVADSEAGRPPLRTGDNVMLIQQVALVVAAFVWELSFDGSIAGAQAIKPDAPKETNAKSSEPADVVQAEGKASELRRFKAHTDWVWSVL